MKASLCLEAAERPQCLRLYLLGRPRSGGHIPSVVGDRGQMVYTQHFPEGIIVHPGSSVCRVPESVRSQAKHCVPSYHAILMVFIQIVSITTYS